MPSSLPRPIPGLAVLASLAVGCTLLAAAVSAHAGELYGQIGLPGFGAGYSQPLNSSFSLRGDYVTLGTRHGTRDEDGIHYDGTLKTGRGALLADWYPLQGTFRFSAGATFNQSRMDLVATGAGGTLTIGGTTYVTTSADQYTAVIRYPRTTPYVGIGWGHQDNSGLRVSADLGASLGRATVTSSVSGPLAAQVTQADIDSETAQLRDTVGKVRFIPQVSLGIGYSF